MNSDFQNSKYVAVESEFVGSFYSISNSITSYLGLKSANEKLMEQTLNLEKRIQYLETQISSMKDSLVAREIINRTDFDSVSYYTYKMAKVVYNSLANKNNYITLNKGTASGIVPDMGVFSATGVVGFVMSASENYSVVLPVLNSNFHLSCKIKDTNYFGSLSWNGKSISHANLHELPSYTQFKNGDTIVTSGYSLSFPEGIPVGIIEEINPQNSNFNSIKVRLLTDFGALNEVLLVDKKGRNEQQALEEAVRDNLERGSKVK